jgi:antitoxin component YwqK of YwqJK toxin-antitoxin module
MPHGIAKTYYTDGSLKEEITYKLGKKTGPYISYHPEGQAAVKGEFLNNQEIGVWEQYDQQGKLAKKITYQRGKIVDEQLIR